MLRALALIACLVLAGCPSALAQAVNAPPGNSGVDEYFETVPGSGGNQPPRNGRRGGARLPPRVRRELAAQGAEGKAALKLAESTGPVAAPRRDRSPGSGSRSRSQAAAPKDGAGSQSASAGGAVRAVRDALGGSDDGGMGLTLPLILLATLALAIVRLVFLRRRRAYLSE